MKFSGIAPPWWFLNNAILGEVDPSDDKCAVMAVYLWTKFEDEEVESLGAMFFVKLAKLLYTCIERNIDQKSSEWRDQLRKVFSALKGTGGSVIESLCCLCLTHDDLAGAFSVFLEGRQDLEKSSRKMEVLTGIIQQLLKGGADAASIKNFCGLLRSQEEVELLLRQSSCDGVQQTVQAAVLDSVLEQFGPLVTLQLLCHDRSLAIMAGYDFIDRLSRSSDNAVLSSSVHDFPFSSIPPTEAPHGAMRTSYKSVGRWAIESLEPSDTGYTVLPCDDAWSVAVSLKQSLCKVCRLPFDEPTEGDDCVLRIFQCGHCYHDFCVPEHYCVVCALLD